MAFNHDSTVLAFTQSTPLNTNSTPVNTTGANLFIATLHAGFVVLGNNGDITDSKGNSWIALTTAPSLTSYCQYFCVPTSVGSGHTFACAASGFFSGELIVVIYDGSDSSPFDQQNQSIGTGPFQTGHNGSCSITPGFNDELIVNSIFTVNQSNPSFSVDSGFTFRGSTLNSGHDMAVADLIQTTAITEDPIWTFDANATQSYVLSSTYKSGGGGITAKSNLLTSLGVGY